MKNPFRYELTSEEEHEMERTAPNSLKCVKVINSLPQDSDEEFYMQNLLLAYVNACYLIKELREGK